MNGAAICYVSFADKRAKYPSKVIPHLYGLAQVQAHSPEVMAFLTANGLPSSPAGLLVDGQWLFQSGLLEALHEKVRAFPYVRKNIPCDAPQSLAATLRDGGDCEDYSVLIAAVLSTWGASWRFVTAGDETDPYRHIWVQVLGAGQPGGQWYDLDPKGSQKGLPFDVGVSEEKYPVRRYWRLA